MPSVAEASSFLANSFSANFLSSACSSKIPSSAILPESVLGIDEREFHLFGMKTLLSQQRLRWETSRQAIDRSVGRTLDLASRHTDRFTSHTAHRVPIDRQQSNRELKDNSNTFPMLTRKIGRALRATWKLLSVRGCGLREAVNVAAAVDDSSQQKCAKQTKSARLFSVPQRPPLLPLGVSQLLLNDQVDLSGAVHIRTDTSDGAWYYRRKKH